MTLQQTTSITKSVSSLSGNKLQIQPLSPPKPILPQKLKKVNFYFNRFSLFCLLIHSGILTTYCYIYLKYRMTKSCTKTHLTLADKFFVFFFFNVNKALRWLSTSGGLTYGFRFVISR